MSSSLCDRQVLYQMRVISSDLCYEDVPRCSCGDSPQLEKLVFVHLDLLTHCKMNHSTAFFHFKHVLKTYRISGDLSGPRETMLSAL